MANRIKFTQEKVMYERKKYKSFALQQLKGRWTVPVLITLVISLISTLFEIPSFSKLFGNQAFWDLANYSGSDYDEILGLYSQVLSAASTSNLTSIIQSIVAAILEIACLNTYLKMSRTPEKVSFVTFIEGLNNWWRAILASLWQFLWVFLWTLLFIIPGIIKSFSYSQMYFLLAENKDLSVTKSMRISMIITKGHKWDLFVTYLSFLGWGILASLTFGIGFLWLTPYIKLTMTNAYHAMLKEAIDKGLIKPEDLSD